MNIQVTSEQALLLKEVVKSAINNRKEVLADPTFIKRYPALTARAQKELAALVDLKEQIFDAEEPDPAVSEPD